MWKVGNKKLGIKGEIVCKNSAKTDSGNRRVAVPRQVLDDLKAFHAEMSDYFVSHDLPTVNLIFPTIYGNYMCDRNERATLKKAFDWVRATKLWFSPIPPYTCFFDAECWCKLERTPDKNGGISRSATMDTYAELAPKKKAEAVEIYLKEIAKLTA